MEPVVGAELREDDEVVVVPKALSRSCCRRRSRLPLPWARRFPLSGLARGRAGKGGASWFSFPAKR
eukprot:13105865-Heterocapsa_arctica.AAC.1